MRASFKVTGLEKIVAKLNTLERKVASSIVRKVLRHCSKTIKPECQKRAPRRTGFLASQIKVRSAKRSRKRIGVLVQIGGGDYKGKAFYGAFNEFGHRIGPRYLGDKRAFRPGRSFMRDGFRAVAPMLQRQAPQMFWDEIAKAVAAA